jgi:outer membrane protein assembly complex protein YaeT
MWKKRSNRRGGEIVRSVLVGLICHGWLALTAAPGSLTAAEEKPAEPAKLSVSGFSWLRNREFRLSLERLLGTERGATLNANAIDDAAFLLVSTLSEEGFLKPVVTIKTEDVAGKSEQFTFDATLTTTLPRTLEARKVEFHIDSGVRYYLADVKIEGLQAMDRDAAEAFFRGENVVIVRKSARAYSPARLSRSQENLQEDLRRRGYSEAQVSVPRLEVDDKTGVVKIGVLVKDGPRWRVKTLTFEGGEGIDAKLDGAKRFVGRPWSPMVQQDVTGEIRKAFFDKGYPDVKIRIAQTIEPEADGTESVRLIATITPGPLVKVGQVKFEGAVKTHESVLRRRVNAKPGEPLDPLDLEQARYRLGRLGVFETIDLRYEPADGDVRSPVFDLKEGRRFESSLLFGYGSYEQLRGGVEVRQYNLFGLAHQSRLLLVQSMKSSRGEYSYTVPELFGESLDGTARVFGLQRDELSFRRQEYGGSVQLSRPLPWIGADATAGYTYQALRNTDNSLSTSASDNKQVNVASVDASLTRDRRDNPLRPRRGYRLFAQLESASRFLGGQVDYQRFEMGGSYHTRWGSGRWLHLGLTHGVITTLGTDDTTLPVNKRFYPGGDTSIRGYREGEAVPRGADGRFVGAKTYTLANIEFEQALTRSFSAVIFSDSLGMAAQLKDYPFNEELYSVGVGVRYHTLIGPIRMEYGRNLNPRVGDPSGTLLISVGFPF